MEFSLSHNRGSKIEKPVNPPYEIILAADLIYHHKIIVPLLRTTYELSDENTEIIYIFESHDAKATKTFWRKVELYFSYKKVTLFVKSQLRYPLDT